jgi:hypothetical protein
MSVMMKVRIPVVLQTEVREYLCCEWQGTPFLPEQVNLCIYLGNHGSSIEESRISMCEEAQESMQ